ncbi:zinc finger BED domain-containing protein 4 [Folsomia candida]|nr:zinc finger BED domain-containing protein 4 [Folsomia candida]
MADNAANICKAFNFDDEIVDPWQIFVKLGDIDNGVRLSDPTDSETEAGSQEVVAEIEIQAEEAEDVEIFDLTNDFVAHDVEIDLKGVKRLRSLAHTVQLAINDAIKQDDQVKQIVRYMNSIIRIFRKSNLMSDELASKTKNQVVPIGQTRWNSILFAAERLLEEDVFIAVQQALIEAKNKSQRVTIPDPPSVHQKALISEMVGYLKPLQILTDRFQGNAVMSSRVIMTIRKAVYDISQSSPKELLSFKKLLLTNMESRFNSVMKQEAYILASLLDPRVKTKPFRMILPFAPTLTEDEAKGLLKIKLTELLPEICEEDPVPSTSSEISLHQNSCDDDMDFMNVCSTTPTTSTQDEMSYINEPCIGKDDDPLVWWSHNAVRFPKLSILARQFLSIPTS